MKWFSLIVLGLFISAPCFGALCKSPLFIHKDNSEEREFQNLYQCVATTVTVQSFVNLVPTNNGSFGTITVSSNAIIGSTTYYQNGPILTNSHGYIIGTIIQSTQAFSTASVGTNSNTYVPVGLAASITPLLSTSIIRIKFSGTVSNASGASMFATIQRNNTELSQSGLGFCNVGSGTSVIESDCGVSYDDFPASTSLLTYVVKVHVNSAGTGTWNANSGDALIKLEEIAQ